jgi:uncharacterized protein YndB with AHSA1/START domain
MENNTFESDILLISRSFAAPIDLVFAAWTSAEHLAKWFGPVGMGMEVLTLDLRPGGTFHYCMTTPDGQKMYGKFVYAAIEAPHRLDYIVSFCDADGNPVRHPLAPTWPLEVVNELSFNADEGGTHMVIRSYPIRANAEGEAIFKANHANVQAGSSGTFAQLDAYLAKLSAPIPISKIVLMPHSLGSNEIRIERLFDAPPTVVWSTLTEPEHLKRWWAPATFITPFISVDLRIGGLFRYCMRDQQGKDFWGRGRYTEIEVAARLAYQDCFTDADGNPVAPSFYGMQLATIEESTVEITLHDIHGQTRMEIRYISHSEIGEERAMAEIGWNEMMDRLADNLVQP